MRYSIDLLVFLIVRNLLYMTNNTAYYGRVDRSKTGTKFANDGIKRRLSKANLPRRH